MDIQKTDKPIYILN